MKEVGGKDTSVRLRAVLGGCKEVPLGIGLGGIVLVWSGLSSMAAAKSLVSFCSD
jgi:hypothetical protein